jgi:hypothetical protein
VYLFDRPENGGALVDSVAFGMQIPDLSIGRLGPQNRWGLSLPTFGGFNAAKATGDPTRLRINEWFANGDVVANDDFIELFNSDTLPVALHGLAISDDPGARPLRHRFAPLSFIAANGFVALTADENIEAGPNHLGFRLSAENGRIALVQSGPPLAGDFNEDGAVNAADVVVWRKNAGQFVPAGTSADGDQNGFINQKDYDVWRANFGLTLASPLPPQNTAVPYWAMPSLKLIDFVSYVAQTTDVSQGRVPDGFGPYQFFTVPTPGATNVTPPAMAFSAAAGSAVAFDAGPSADGVDGFFDGIGIKPSRQRRSLPPARIAGGTDDDSLLMALATRGAEQKDEASPRASSIGRTREERTVDQALASFEPRFEAAVVN